MGRGHATWVGPYIDVNGRPSVSYVEPVYDNVTDRLIGVAGTDINLDGIKARLERITQDFYGYSFLVDNNGQTVYHSTSDIDTLYDISLYETFGESQEDSVEDEANYKSFMENVRHSLVARVQGVSRISKTIDYLPVCIVNGITDYYYRPIANTLFSVAVAFPRYTMGNVAFETPDDADWVKNTYMSDIFSVSELDEFSVPRGIVITNVSDVDGRSHLTSFTHASVHVNK